MKKILFFYGVFLFAFDVFCEVFVNVPVFAKAPKIDGNLNENFWKNALIYECDQSIENKRLKDRWKVFIGCDHAAIYIGIDADISEPYRILNLIKKRDDKVWNDDCFEIMIDYRNDCTSYIQFLINTNGVRCDLFRTLNNDRIDPQNFDGDWQGVCQVKKEKIFAEFQIPYAIFDLYGKKDNNFRINIGRENKYQNEYSSITGTFHEIDKFVVLKNLPIPLILKQIKVNEVNWQTNFGSNFLTASITNSSNRTIRFRTTMIDRNGLLTDTKNTGKLILGKNEIRKNYTILGEPGVRELVLSIIDAENGMILKKTSKVFMLLPAIYAHSDKYAYDEQDEKMELNIKLNIDRDILKIARMKIFLEGEKLLWQADNLDPETYTIINIKSIPFGIKKILLDVEYGKIKTKVSIPFRKVKSPFYMEEI